MAERIFWQFLLVVILSAAPIGLAWWGYSVESAFLLYLGCCIALAPPVAIAAMKMKWI